MPLSMQESAALRNSNLRRNAAERLALNATKKKADRSYTGRKAECAPNRKAQKALDARKKDWQAMVDGPQWKGNVSGYHMPGSMNRH